MNNRTIICLLFHIFFLPFCAFSDNSWSGLFLIDSTQAMHEEASTVRPAISFPLILHVDEHSVAYKHGFRGGDFILGTPDHEIKTVKELETLLRKKPTTPLKIQNASGLKILEFSLSKANPDSETFLRLKNLIDKRKIPDSTTLDGVIKKHPSSSMISFIAAFAYNSINEKEKAYQCLDRTIKLAPESLLAKLSVKRLPKSYLQEDSSLSLVQPAEKGNQSESIKEVLNDLQSSSSNPQMRQEKIVLSDLPVDQKTFTALSLDEKIVLLRKHLVKVPKSVNIRKALTMLLLNKISKGGSQSYDEVEPLFREASDLSPDMFLVPYMRGNFLYRLKKYEEAIPHFEDAMRLNSEEVDCIMKLAISYMSCMKFEEAIPHFEKARQKIPNDFFLLYYLGKCYFEQKDFDSAVEVWKEALEVAKTPQDKEAIQRLIQKALEQGASIAGMTKDENQRFIIHYAGNSQKDIGDLTIEVLESVYDQVTDDLLYKPDIKINVVFFLTEEFYKLNQAGSWVGAITQGVKIYVPLRQGYSDSSSVKGILAHEFTHVIVNLRTNQRCPTWINEGIAVYEEFKAAYQDPNTMREDYERIFEQKMKPEKLLAPLNSINLNPSKTYETQISYGYLESYLAVRFLIDRWGLQGFDDLLSSLGSGSHPDNAIEEATGRNQTQFENEFAEWIQGI